MGWLARFLGHEHKADDERTAQLRRALVDAPEDARQGFEHCSEQELRAMTAMRRHDIYNKLSFRQDAPANESVAYAMTAHAWWICALAIDGDRKQELRGAIKRQAWQEVIGEHPALDELLKLTTEKGAATDELRADELSRAVWRALGLRADLRCPS